MVETAAWLEEFTRLGLDDAVLAARPKNKHGQHEYSAPRGLDTGALRAKYSAYLERFNIMPED